MLMCLLHCMAREDKPLKHNLLAGTGFRFWFFYYYYFMYLLHALFHRIINPLACTIGHYLVSFFPHRLKQDSAVIFFPG